MRTIGFHSNILFALAAGLGLIASLGLPWYGPPNPATDAQMEDLLAGVGRAVTAPGGTDGWTALATADQLLAGFAVATVVLVLLTLIVPVQRFVQALARWTALVTVGVVVAKLVDGPNAASMGEPRNGLLLALAASLVLLVSSWTVAAAPSRRKTPPKSYTPPPVPVYRPDDSYGPPQF